MLEDTTAERWAAARDEPTTFGGRSGYSCFPPLTPLMSLLFTLSPPPPPLPPVDCAAEATKLARGSCSSLRPIFFERGGGAAAYGTASDCGVLKSALDATLKGADIPAACCRDARVFVSGGCACDESVAALIEGLRDDAQRHRQPAASQQVHDGGVRRRHPQPVQRRVDGVRLCGEHVRRGT